MTRAALFLSLCLPVFAQDAPDDLLRSLPAAGVAVQIGWDEASPAIRRAEQGGWLVHVLVADEGKAAAARQRLEGRGLYGRVSVEVLTAPMSRSFATNAASYPFSHSSIFRVSSD